MQKPHSSGLLSRAMLCSNPGQLWKFTSEVLIFLYLKSFRGGAGRAKSTLQESITELSFAYIGVNTWVMCV